MPAGRNVPQVMPAEVLDAGTAQRVLPRRRVRVRERPASEGEHAVMMLSKLLAQHRDGFII